MNTEAKLESKKAKSRDPFFLSARFEQPSMMAEVKNVRFVLMGIVRSGEKIGALIKNRQKTGMVFQGGVIDGYAVEKIAPDHILLVKGTKTKTLRFE